MKASNIRAAELRDAENLRQLFQMSIRRLCASHYTPEQLQRWTDRRVVATLEALRRDPEAAGHDAFDDEFKDLRNDLLGVCSGEESDCEGLDKMASILENA